MLYGGLVAAAHLRADQRRPRRRTRSGGFRSASSTCSLGVRPPRAGADSRDVLRREPARRPQLRRPGHRRRCSSSCRFSSLRKQPDLGTAVTLVPVCFGIAYLAGLRAAAHRHCRHCRGAARAGRVEIRAEGLSEITHRRRSSIRKRTRAAPAISRSRRASPSGPAA